MGYYPGRIKNILDNGIRFWWKYVQLSIKTKKTYIK